MTGKKSNGSDTNDGVPHSSVSVRINWVRLLEWVFDIEIEHCPHCGENENHRCYSGIQRHHQDSKPYMDAHGMPSFQSMILRR